LAIETAKKMVTFQVVGTEEHKDKQMVRFYLYLPRADAEVVRLNIRDAASSFPAEGAFTNITFLYNNLFDSATVTASSNHRKFPPSRIQHRWGTYHWRSWGDPLGDPRPDALASQWVKADLGSAEDIRAVLVWYHNFYRGATVDVQGNAADAWGGPTLDENITLYDAHYPIIKLWDTAKNYQWWRIPIDGDYANILTEGDFNEAVSYFDYARIGRIFIGDYFRPNLNFKRGYVLGKEDMSQTFPTLEGQMVSNVAPRYETLVCEFEGVSASDLAEFVTMWETVGTTKPFWIVQNAGRWYDQTYYVVFADNLGIKRQPGTEKYDLRIVVEEVT